VQISHFWCLSSEQLIEEHFIVECFCLLARPCVDDLLLIIVFITLLLIETRHDAVFDYGSKRLRTLINDAEE